MTITLTMDDRQLSSIYKVEQFTENAASVLFRGTSRREKYAWILSTLTRFRYRFLRKKERSVIKQFIVTTTGYSDVQSKRLIGQYLGCGKVLVSAKKKHRFSTIYTAGDVKDRFF